MVKERKKNGQREKINSYELNKDRGNAVQTKELTLYGFLFLWS